jgi:hypothetical protein
MLVKKSRFSNKDTVSLPGHGRERHPYKPKFTNPIQTNMVRVPDAGVLLCTGKVRTPPLLLSRILLRMLRTYKKNYATIRYRNSNV